MVNEPSGFEPLKSYCYLLFSLNCLTSLIVAISLLLILILLFRSGNVSPNPGPDSVNSSFNSDLSSVSSATEELISNHLSEMRLNIQSIVPKIDVIKGESEEYDVHVLTDSWLKETIANYCHDLEHICFCQT